MFWNSLSWHGVFGSSFFVLDPGDIVMVVGCCFCHPSFCLPTCLSHTHSVICSTHSCSGVYRARRLTVAGVEGRGYPHCPSLSFSSLYVLDLIDRRAFGDVLWFFCIYPDPSPYSLHPTDRWTSCVGFPCFCSFYLVSFPWLSEELYELYFSVTNVVFCIAVFKNYICFMYFLP